MTLRRLVVAVALATGCAAEQVPCESLDEELSAVAPVLDGAVTASPAGADGNHVVEGSGDFSGARALSVPLPFTPEWIVALPEPGGSVWVATAPGRAPVARRIPSTAAAPEDVSEVDLVAVPRAADQAPPTLVRNPDGGLHVLDAGGPDRAAHAPPLWLGDRFAWVTCSGDLVVGVDGLAADARLAVAALPDARITRAGDRLAVLGDATARYTHGALGDDVEGGAIYVVDASTSLRRERRIVLPDREVIEGTRAAWVDLDGDGTLELAATGSNLPGGARHRLYDPDTGALIAESGGSGGSGRWRHRIAGVDLGSGPRIVAVRTPHIGGVAEVLRLDGGELAHTAEREEFSSHGFARRNLDQGLVADLAGDATPELLVPTQSQDALVVLALEAAGGSEQLVEVARRPLEERLASNVFAVDTDVGLVVGAAHRGGVLTVWLPQ